MRSTSTSWSLRKAHLDHSQNAAIEAAVAASTAVAGIQAPITVGEHRYMDGGAHIDAAQGYGIVAIVTGPVARAVRQSASVADEIRHVWLSTQL